LTIQLIRNADKKFIEKWRAFDKQHNTYNIFQSPQIFELYQQTNRYTPFLLVDINDQGDIECIFIYSLYKGFSLLSFFLKRATTTGLPIGINQLAQKKMLNYLSSFRNKPYHLLKITLDDDLLTFSQSPENFGLRHEGHLNYLIDLNKSQEDLWKNISETRRKQIKRAEKRGLSVKMEHKADNIKEVYNVLMETYKRTRLEKEEIDIFLNCNNYLSANNNVRYFMAYADEKLVGFRIVLIYKKYIYDWYAGNLSDYQSHYPNDLLVWEVLKWGNENGYTTFNFGGAGKPGIPYGVREFKKRFGGRLVDYGYWVDTDNLFKLAYQYLNRKNTKNIK
jgi:serine/alanine adding enzyme